MTSAPTATNPAPSPASTLEGDTTLALASLAPYSSDGPTLPLILRANEHAPNTSGGQQGTTASPTTAASSANPHKKRKTNPSAVADQGPEKRSKTPASAQIPCIPHADLQTPWIFLPPDVRAAVQRRLGCTGDAALWWQGRCVSVVYTRNQNVGSAVRRLQVLLGCGGDVPDALRGEGGIIAVSAQGAAVTKVVGVLEVVRRIVGGGRGSQGRKWCMYTCLSSRVAVCGQSKSSEGLAVAGKNGGGGGPGSGAGAGAGDADDMMKDVEDDGFEARPAGAEGSAMRRKIPVLTVWLSRTRIAEFEKEFGGQEVEVVNVQREEEEEEED